MEETIKIEVEFKITYESKTERKEAIKIAKYNVMGDETHLSTISVKPVKASEIK